MNIYDLETKQLNQEYEPILIQTKLNSLNNNIINLYLVDVRIEILNNN